MALQASTETPDARAACGQCEIKVPIPTSPLAWPRVASAVSGEAGDHPGKLGHIRKDLLRQS